MDPAYLSYSQIRTYLDCPRRYFFERMEEIEPEFTAGSLLLGTAVHSAAAWFHTALMGGKAVKESEVSELAQETLVSLLSGSKKVNYSNGDDQNSLVSQAGELASVLYESIPVREIILGVEKEHSFRMVNSGGEDLGIPMKAVLDKIVSADGGVIGVDLKTASPQAKSGYTDEWLLDKNLQATAYCWAMEDMFGKKPQQAFRFDVLVKPTKTKPAEFLCFPTTRGQGDFDSLWETAFLTLKGIRAGSFPPAIPGWQCKACPYAYCCR